MKNQKNLPPNFKKLTEKKSIFQMVKEEKEYALKTGNLIKK